MMNRLITLVTILAAMQFASGPKTQAMEQTITPNGAAGRVLTDQWKAYDAAVKADRPQQMAEILASIKQEAIRRHYAADFFDAGKAYIDVCRIRNWKSVSDARNEFAEEVRAFNDPVVMFAWMEYAGSFSVTARFRYVEEQAARMRKTRSPHFIGELSLMGRQLPYFIANDYEYALWLLLTRSQLDGQKPESSAVYTALKAEVSGRYPNEGYLEQYRCDKMPVGVDEPCYTALAEQYKDRGLGFWPRQVLLRRKFDNLKRYAPDREADFKQIFSEAQAFEHGRSLLTGDEKRIATGCTAAADIIKEMQATDLGVEFRRDTVCLTFRNLPAAGIKLYQVDLFDRKKTRETVFHRKVDNPAQRFYVRDRAECPLPALDDGDYQLVATASGVEDRVLYYTQHTLSLALRREKDGYGAYVADYRSGAPVKQADLTLYLGDRVVEKAKDFVFDGFTLLPEAFQKRLNKNDDKTYYLVASLRDGGRFRMSGAVEKGWWYSPYDHADTDTRCHIYRDRGAYNPGDLLQFKAVVCRGDFVKAVEAVEGLSLNVTLYDSENNKIESLELVTNEFGSVSGAFSLPLDRRNGRYSLDIRRSSGGHLASCSFPVDAFVLPTYELSFEREEKLFFPGDEVTVKGRLASYTGHSLGGATLSASVERYGEVIPAEIVKRADGSFTLRFTPKNAGYYRVNVRVMDETGETQEFGTGVFVADAVRVSLTHRNAAKGHYDLLEGSGGASCSLLTETSAIVGFEVRNSNGDRVPVSAAYRVLDSAGKVCFQGSAASGEELTWDFSALPDGLYTVTGEVSIPRPGGNILESKESLRILKLQSGSGAIPAAVTRLVMYGDAELETGETLRMCIGSTSAPLWVVAELFGEHYELLARKLVKVDGGVGQRGSLVSVEFEYKASYPDAVELQLFAFRDGGSYRERGAFHRRRHTLDLPLAFEGFEDRTRPAGEYRFTLRTDPGVEALVAVFDKAIDAIQRNDWRGVSLRDFTVSAPSIRSQCGLVGSVPYFDEPVLETRAAGRANAPMAMKRDSAPVMMEEVAVSSHDSAVAEAAGDAAEEPVGIREKFENALAFLPHLRSDADGRIEVSFATSDKLSTYHVQVFAHDRRLRNDVQTRDLLVTIPLKVAVTTPRFLYDGDRYRLAVSVASNLEKAVTGTLACSVYAGAAHEGVAPASVQRQSLTVPAGASAPAFFDIPLPAGADTVGLKVVFSAGANSDAVFVPIPVLPALQSLTEAHSAVLLPGMDRAALLAELQGRFVNISPSAADFREITVLDMVRDAIPDKAEPKRLDALSLSEAYYVRQAASRLGMSVQREMSDAELLKKLLACRNGDGGFAWFEGMSSSRVITAVMLERMARLRDRGFEVPDMRASVKYLDKKQFDRSIPYWCGGLSLAKYLHVRSLYPDVPWTVDALGSRSIFDKQMKTFKKELNEYLVPSEKDGRGLNGRILDKARRTRTLQNLSASKEGLALAKAMGIKWGTASKLEKSLRADVLSLSEYAVAHRDGGMYYPNAVLPWRGLLESEAYAHSLLCDLLASQGRNDIADGIRIWLMLQKETQHWDSSAEFVDAVSSILDGSEEALSTRVLVYKADFTKPFREILATGNGFTIERRFFRAGSAVDEDSGRENRTLTEIAPGTFLHRGDRIVAEYRIWNQENRSFVQVVVPREATLQPVNQLSCRIGWWLRPLSVDGWYSFSPQGYRNVKADRTEYYFDSYPEEKTTLTEEFFVQQDGVFSAPVVSIESLYAPHYRANGAFTGAMQVGD